MKKYFQLPKQIFLVILILLIDIVFSSSVVISPSLNFFTYPEYENTVTFSPTLPFTKGAAVVAGSNIFVTAFFGSGNYGHEASNVYIRSSTDGILFYNTTLISNDSTTVSTSYPYPLDIAMDDSCNLVISWWYDIGGVWYTAHRTSNDCGKTFLPIQYFANFDARGYVAGNGDGTFIILGYNFQYSGGYVPGSSNSYVKKSIDGGKTWTQATKIVASGINDSDNSPTEIRGAGTNSQTFVFLFSLCSTSPCIVKIGITTNSGTSFSVRSTVDSESVPPGSGIQTDVALECSKTSDVCLVGYGWKGAVKNSVRIGRTTDYGFTFTTIILESDVPEFSNPNAMRPEIATNSDGIWIVTLTFHGIYASFDDGLTFTKKKNGTEFSQYPGSRRFLWGRYNGKMIAAKTGSKDFFGIVPWLTFGGSGKVTLHEMRSLTFIESQDTGTPSPSVSPSAIVITNTIPVASAIGGIVGASLGVAILLGTTFFLYIRSRKPSSQVSLLSVPHDIPVIDRLTRIVPSQYIVFVSYQQASMGPSVQLFEQHLNKQLGDLEEGMVSNVFVDTISELDRLEKIQNKVLASKCLTIILKDEVYKRPYCLVEWITAVVAGIPIVTVWEDNDPVFFKNAKEFILHLKSRLLRQDKTILKKFFPELTIYDIMYLLEPIFDIIPKKFSLTDPPAVVDEYFKGIADDILNRGTLVRPKQFLGTWLENQDYLRS